MAEIYTVEVQITQGTIRRIYPSLAFQDIVPGTVRVKRILTWYEIPTENVEKFYLLEDNPEYKNELWVGYFYVDDGNGDTSEYDLYLPIGMFVNHTTTL